MNKDGQDFDWGLAKAFLATVTEGSLSAAARRLGTSQPTLSRQVSAFADELGVTLFERVGRGLVLTEAGADIAAHLQPMADAANATARAATGQAQSIDGHIRITATELYSALILPPVIKRLRDTAPGVTIEIVASDKVTDLRRREADIAIRNARPNDPELFARKVAEDHGTFYATPEYLQSIGNPKCLDDLAKADFIAIDDPERSQSYYSKLGMPLSIQNFPVFTAHIPAQWAYVVEGIGIGVAPIHLGDKEPRVQRLFDGASILPIPVWVVAHREVRTSRRVRLVFDLLTEMLPEIIRSV